LFYFALQRAKEQRGGVRLAIGTVNLEGGKGKRGGEVLDHRGRKGHREREGCWLEGVGMGTKMRTRIERGWEGGACQGWVLWHRLAMVHAMSQTRRIMFL
jgi:hypothetical protein